MEENNASPVIKKTATKEMSFPEVIKELIAGKKITRIDWDNKESFGELKDGFLMIHLDGIYHKWIVNDGDLLSTDWIII